MTVSQRNHFRTRLKSRLWQINRAKAIKVTAGVVEGGRTSDASDDSKLGKLMQLQVAEGLPGANHRDICKKEKNLKANITPKRASSDQTESFGQRHCTFLSYSLSRWLETYLEWPWSSERIRTVASLILLGLWCPQNDPSGHLCWFLFCFLFREVTEGFCTGNFSGGTSHWCRGPPQGTTTQEKIEVEF